MVDLSKCDKCGDESNSAPDLPCGRALGLDADGDETQAPYCDGVYRRQPRPVCVTIIVHTDVDLVEAANG